MQAAHSVGWETVASSEDRVIPPPGNFIRLVILESDPVIRDSLCALMDRSPGLRCVASPGSVSTALQTMPDLRPDVILLDGRLLSLHGADLVAKFKSASPSTHILILTTFESGDLLFDAVRAGASGDLAKTAPPVDLVRTIQSIHAGGSPISMPIARRLAVYLGHGGAAVRRAVALTIQERSVLDALARGVSYRTIADECGVGQSTVLSRLRGVCNKLNAMERVT
jgi:DNA-binding NarL/FixJ family response regulator